MKLDKQLIDKINSYWEETTDKQIWLELGIDRHTVGKYRSRIADTLTRGDKKKLDLLKTYSDKDVQEMLNQEGNRQGIGRTRTFTLLTYWRHSHLSQRGQDGCS